MMNPRERILATFSGQPVDHFPVTVPYLMLFQSDFWERIYRQPSWTYYDWCLKNPADHLPAYRQMDEILPFDIAQPNQWASSRKDRQFLRIVEGADGIWYREDARTGSKEKIELNLHEKDRDVEWSRVIYSETDIDEKIAVHSASEILERGHLDYLSAYHKLWGHERWIAGTLINAFYMSSHYVGLTNRFLLISDEPGLLHAIIDRLTQRNIEEARALAQSGCDAVFIDDATATMDMVSKKVYDEFSRPYLKRQVDEIHNLGMKAILIYFGGIADRVENIVSVGADALLMETSMKGFTNDLDEISKQVDNRMLLFGNLNPIQDLEESTDEELIGRLNAQIAIGKRYGRFVVSTGSPVTPGTSLERVQDYIRWAHELSTF